MLKSAANEKRLPVYFPNSLDLKNQLEEIASSEGRSVAQVCELSCEPELRVTEKKASAFCDAFSPGKKGNCQGRFASPDHSGLPGMRGSLGFLGL
jgi:hypothetical protein